MSQLEYTRNNVILAGIEQHFPFVHRPSDSYLYAYDKNDTIRQLIDQPISGYIGPELPYEGVMYLRDELGTLTPKAVQWILPSTLRYIVARTSDPVTDLIRWLIWLVESSTDADVGSAYDLSWLTPDQREVLMCLVRYLSKELDEDTEAARRSLRLLRSGGSCSNISE